MIEPLTFTSDHNGTSRTYRVVDPGTADRLASCEYLRVRAWSANKWRPAKSGNTRHVALEHGTNGRPCAFFDRETKQRVTAPTPVQLRNRMMEHIAARTA